MQVETTTNQLKMFIYIDLEDYYKHLLLESIFRFVIQISARPVPTIFKDHLWITLFLGFIIQFSKYCDIMMSIDEIYHIVTQ